MEFADAEQVEQFFNDVPEFERMLVRSGIIVLKYWFSISDEEQQIRFLMRINDPMKQWKISKMDLESRIRWEDYTKAKEEMFSRTNIPEAPWYIVEGDDKKRERLNCIEHIISMVPYKEIQHEPVKGCVLYLHLLILQTILPMTKIVLFTFLMLIKSLEIN